MDNIEAMEHEILSEMREQPEKYEVIENEYCTVDDITRVVTVPEQYKTLGVETDQAVKKIWFRFPRIVGNNNTDLSVLSVRIHYRNANGDIDGYIVKDLEADGEDNVIFSWEIGGNVALYKGNVEFIVCAVKTDDEGLVHREWNTKLNKDCVVLEGLELGKIEIKPTEKDIIAQLIQYVKNESAEAVKKVTASKEESILAVKNEGLKQIENVQNEAEKIVAEREQIEKNKTDIATLNEEMELLAPSIICTASGESIKVDDSAERKMQGFDLHGKTEQTKTLGYQLFDASKLPTKSQGGATVTNNGDGSFTVSGSGDLTNSFNVSYEYSHEETIKLFKSGKLNLKTEQTTNPYFVANLRNKDGQVLSLTNNTSAIASTDITNWINDETCFLIVQFYGALQNIKPGTIKPMLYQDGDGTWEPFTGGKPSPSPDYKQKMQGIGEEKDGKYAVGVKANGKNLLDADKYYSDMKVGDVFEDTANNFYLVKIPLPKKFKGKKLTFSALVYHVSASSNIRCSARVGGKVNDGNGSSKINEWFLSKISFTMMNETDTIFFNYGSSDNVRIKNIQLEENSEQTSYEPYKESPFRIQLDSPLYEGDKIYLEDGELWEYRENAKVVFDGSEDEKKWNAEIASDNNYAFYLNNGENLLSNARVSCDKLQMHSNYQVSSALVEGISVDEHYNSFRISINKERLTAHDSQAFKTWLQSNPIEVVYKLKTPTIKKLGSLEDFGELKTYYPITHITNNEDAEMVVEYVADTKNYVDNKVAANVANIISQYQTNISNLLSLMPIEIQATIIGNDTNKILEEVRGYE